MATGNIHTVFINQESSDALWNCHADFETIQPMVFKKESPESTQAVAERLRLTRQAFGMKKAPWSRFVGITPQAWNNVEGTETSPAANRISVDEALKVCRATGVGLNWIFRGDRDDVPIKVALELQKLDPPAKRKAAGKKP
jgi:DNA-binding XRE family transcriptional regulator